MSKNMKRARTGALVLVCLCFVALGIVVTVHEASARQQSPDARDVATALIRVGLDVEALAAAGVSASQVQSLIQNAVNDFAQNPGVLEGVQSVYAAAKRSRDEYVRLVRSGTATPEEVDAANQARSAYTSAQSNLQDALDGVFEVSSAGLDAGVVTLLARIEANRGWNVPIEFLTVDRSEPDWVILRDALAHERINTELGEPVSPEVQTLLQQLRSDPTVAAARANLDANLALIEATWQQELGL